VFGDPNKTLQTAVISMAAEGHAQWPCNFQTDFPMLKVNVASSVVHLLLTKMVCPWLSTA
jgi:hypothetical protein